jgi:hypothetical protein
MTKYSAVTTFHQAGYNQYAQKFLKTFITNWPKDLTLYAYAEDCPVTEDSPNLIVRDLHQSSQDLVKFKERWKNVPKANGNILSDPVRGKRRDSNKSFKWDAVRFSHKVYSIFHCAQNSQADVLIWMDADMVCHSPITMNDIISLVPIEKDICYLGREGKFPECGLYTLNLTSEPVKDFLKEFQRVYDDAENGIFLMDEWHDSFVFEKVLKKSKNLKILNWSSGLGDLRPSSTNSLGEGHPLINSKWGAYLDHLKGSRKKTGKSLPTDIKVNRKEAYWKKW